MMEDSLNNQSEGFNPETFANLYEWEKNNFWFESRNARIIHLAKTYLKEPFHFLEIGCGTGYVIEGLHQTFKKSTFVGSEYYSEGLEFAQKRNSFLKFIQMDARNIPFNSEFDCIGAFDVIEHIEEDLDVLRQIHKALKSNGYVIITVPQHKFLWSHVDEIAYHKRRYTKYELMEKMKLTGFKVLNINSFTSLLFPLMYVSRLLQKKNANPESEFLISSFTNNILKIILRLEFWLVKIGIKFPFGGSLILIGTKA